MTDLWGGYVMNYLSKKKVKKSNYQKNFTTYLVVKFFFSKILGPPSEFPGRPWRKQKLKKSFFSESWIIMNHYEYLCIMTIYEYLWYFLIFSWYTHATLDVYWWLIYGANKEIQIHSIWVFLEAPGLNSCIQKEFLLGDHFFCTQKDVCCETLESSNDTQMESIGLETVTDSESCTGRLWQTLSPVLGDCDRLWVL